MTTCKHNRCAAPLRLLWGTLSTNAKLLCGRGTRTFAQQPFWAGRFAVDVTVLVPWVMQGTHAGISVFTVHKQAFNSAL